MDKSVFCHPILNPTFSTEPGRPHLSAVPCNAFVGLLRKCRTFSPLLLKLASTERSSKYTEGIKCVHQIHSFLSSPIVPSLSCFHSSWHYAATESYQIKFLGAESVILSKHTAFNGGPGIIGDGEDIIPVNGIDYNIKVRLRLPNLGSFRRTSQ